MSGTELIALGHAALARAHELILLGGVLGVLSILAGLISRRVGAPMLLVFLALGMLAGEDGVLGIPYDDFQSAYLISSVALAVILFEGGLKTPLAMFRLALWPAVLLATIGVAITALMVGFFISLVDHVPLLAALLAGSAAAPTDAAAVAVLMRRAGAALPKRLSALLEVESGLNDPMSVSLTFLVMHLIAEPVSFGFADAVLLCPSAGRKPRACHIRHHINGLGERCRALQIWCPTRVRELHALLPHTTGQIWE